jgi:hypothetical protein
MEQEQGQYREDHFDNSNQGGQPGYVAPPPPFIPARADNGPAKQSQAKAIIILLVCILAVNVATFVTQNFLSPRGMTFSGAPGFGSGGVVTQGDDSGAQQRQTPPDFEHQDGGEASPNFEQQQEE